MIRYLIDEKKYDEAETILLHSLEVSEKLGAKDPKSWATSEINEDIPQLVTFLILRKLPISV